MSLYTLHDFEDDAKAICAHYWDHYRLLGVTGHSVNLFITGPNPPIYNQVPYLCIIELD